MDENIERKKDGKAEKEGGEIQGQLFSVKVLYSSEILLCAAPEGMGFTAGDLVVVDTRYGRDLGEVLGLTQDLGCGKKSGGEDSSGITEIIRFASQEDRRKHEEDKLRGAEAYELCRKKILQHKLDMKLVSAHYLLEETKILFFFTADARVDFRELVKDLVSVFKTRIELRQIGVRDESRVLGGIGVCGRSYCCHGITDKLKPVSIKMAKAQNLSLNSMKISGPCGRLLCCLSYEFEAYSEEKKRLPNEGYKINYDNALFKVIEVNILSRRVKLLSDDGRLLEVPTGRFFQDERSQRWRIRELESS